MRKGLFRAQILVAIVVLAGITSCTSAMVNPQHPSAYLADDQAACDKQAFQETGQYNRTKAFKIAKKQCMTEKGWTRTYEVAAW